MALPLNRFAAAAAHAVADGLGLDPASFVVGTPPKPELGDLAVGCFPAAKALGQAPPALAARVVDAFEPGELLVEASAAGPFVNFRIRREALFEHLFACSLGDGGDLIPKTVGAGKTVCIDYSSPNISKHLAYHHIRSTVIGHALVNLYRALGYRVVGVNHLGDWGTTHGMLLAAYDRWGPIDDLDINALNELYVRFRREMERDPSLEAEGRAWFARLEQGDARARELWETFKAVSWAEFQSVYDTLGIVFEEVKGESAYLGDVPKVLALLEEAGLSTISEGALVVPLEEDGMPPLLLRKQDGATLYGTRDLAAAIYRWETYAFQRNLYVVDRGQGLHFRQLFRTLAKAGMEWAERCAHVPFGLVRIGGKKTGTRSGNVVLLKEVFGEAAARSTERIRDKNPEMPAELLEDTARAVGVGAVVFANLMSQREKDVDFDWDDILSTEGDSGPYVQYAHARCANILERAGEAVSAEVDVSLLATEHEWALARQLAELPDVVARAADGNEPHVVSRYLIDLVSTFSRWYTAGNGDPALRVLCEDTPTRHARLALVATTRDVLRTTLGLLGLQAPSSM